MVTSYISDSMMFFVFFSYFRGSKCKTFSSKPYYSGIALLLFTASTVNESPNDHFTGSKEFHFII